MAEAVMTRLVEKGMGRGEAHELARTCSQKAIADGKDLFTVLLNNNTASKYLDKKELEEVLNPANYLGVSDTYQYGRHKWSVNAKKGNENHHLGMYDDELDAARAYDDFYSSSIEAGVRPNNTEEDELLGFFDED